MRTWHQPRIPELPGTPPPLQNFDSATREVKTHQEEDLRLWICGITPYDATHLGHAFTYVSFDTLARVWSDGGRPLYMASNITDMDDPLYERAEQTGVDWHELAQEQTELFRTDMEALAVLPPDVWQAVSEILDPLEDLIRRMEANGLAYRVAGEDGDEYVYADLGSDAEFASAPVFKDMDLIAEFDEHGGDSEKVGKKHPLDPQLWKGVRGQDYRPAGLKPGAWRPGWHIECALMALQNLGRIDVQAGGSDLLFPHHEMSEHHMRELTDGTSEVAIHAHSGMVGFEGEKMSKSLGNLVLVSKLRQSVDPRAIRLALLSNHYRSDWEYSDDLLAAAKERLARWTEAVNADLGGDDEVGQRLLTDLREALSNDLDTSRALELVDACLQHVHGWASEDDRVLVKDSINALLGVAL